jgi:hypothetical protein
MAKKREPIDDLIDAHKLAAAEGEKATVAYVVADIGPACSARLSATD